MEKFTISAVSGVNVFINENRFKFADENDNWYKWTVFLRDNNTGKTNLLKAIAVWNLIMIPPLLRRQVVSIRILRPKTTVQQIILFSQNPCTLSYVDIRPLQPVFLYLPVEGCQADT